MINLPLTDHIIHCRFFIKFHSFQSLVFIKLLAKVGILASQWGSSKSRSEELRTKSVAQKKGMQLKVKKSQKKIVLLSNPYQIQLNEYETEPYFLQFFQSNSKVCLIIYMFCESCNPEVVLNYYAQHQIRHQTSALLRTPFKRKTTSWSQI